MIRRIGLAVVILALGSMAALAADFNGKWTATVQMPKNPQTLSFDFHVDGSTLTGTITTPRGDAPITDGKVDGDNISFSQTMNGKKKEIKLLYTGTATGDTIKFSRQRGKRPPTEFVAKRAQ